MKPIADPGELVARAVASDEDALRELVQRYHDRVYRFGVKVCHNRFDADDAVQQAFIVLARRVDVQRSTNVLHWLLSVVRNACRSMLGLGRRARHTSLSASPEAMDVPDESLSSEAMMQRFQLVSEVHDAIALLDPEGRAVLILRDIEGLSGEETAARLGVSMAAMKSRLHRARLSVGQHVRQRRGPAGEA